MVANLTYGFQNMYADSFNKQFRWDTKMNQRMPIAGDQGPGSEPVTDISHAKPGDPPNIVRASNSNNHRERGQNVLYPDGHVVFSDVGWAGLFEDYIYDYRQLPPGATSGVYDVQSDIIQRLWRPDDTYLLPSDDH